MDNDQRFTNKFWNKLFRHFERKLTPSSPYYQRTAGQGKVVSKEIEEMNHAFVQFDKSKLDENIFDFEAVYKSAKHTSTGPTRDQHRSK